MKDLAVAALIAVALSYVGVFVTSALVAEHTSAEVPRRLAGKIYSRGRKTLLIEVPFVAFLLGGGELILTLALVHPDSTAPVRLIAGVQLACASCWLVYLARLIRESRRGPDDGHSVG